MRSAPPSLNAIRIFVCVARHLSFQRAAGELCLTPGALSRQVRALEECLGQPLFERRHRAIVLTATGRDYLARVAPALAEIEQAGCALSALRGQAEDQRQGLRLDATPTFAMHWLIPRLADFRRRYPQLEVQLRTSQGEVQRDSPVDLFIRRDPAHFGGLAGVAFMTEYSTLVCRPSPDGRPPADACWMLQNTPLIRMRSRPDLWPKYFSRQKIRRSAQAADIEFDNTILAIQAALEGLGVGLFPVLFVEALLAGASLCELPGGQRFASGNYFLLRNPGRESPAVEQFAAWLRTSALA